MSGSDNFEAMGPPPQDQRPQAQNGTMRDLDAVYDIPVQISAVLGRATMQVSQLLKQEEKSVMAHHSLNGSQKKAKEPMVTLSQLHQMIEGF